jgi:stage IV sporulation protein FB
VAGIEIHLNIFFLALIGLFFVAGVLGKGLIAFAVVFLHELGHIISARRLGVLVSDVELLPFGGVSRLGEDLFFDPSKEIYVAVAGPLVNVVLVGLGVAMKNYGLWDETLGPFFLQCNLMVAAFNLLPAFPLDGGRIFRAWLAGRTGFRRATYYAACWGQAWGVIVVAGGFLGFLLHLSGLDVIVTGLFLVYAATREKVTAPYHFIRHLLRKKEEIARLGVSPCELAVALDTVPLGEIIRTFVPQRFSFIFLLDSNRRYRGMVSEDEVIETMLSKGFDFPVGRLLEQK